MTTRYLFRRLLRRVLLGVLLFSVQRLTGLSSDITFILAFWLVMRSVSDTIDYFVDRSNRNWELRGNAILAAISTAEEQRIYVIELAEKLGEQGRRQLRRLADELAVLEIDDLVQVYDQPDCPIVKCVAILNAGRARLDAVTKSVTPTNQATA